MKCDNYLLLKKTVFIILLIIFQCCTWNKNTGFTPDCPSETETVSFSANIVPVLNVNCNLSGCHQGSFPTGNLNLEPSKAYNALNRKGAGYIDTLDPRSSVLYASLVSSSNPMPPGGRLSTCDLNVIVNWMKQGAKNN